jgi:hypothetical protein
MSRSPTVPPPVVVLNDGTPPATPPARSPTPPPAAAPAVVSGPSPAASATPVARVRSPSASPVAPVVTAGEQSPAASAGSRSPFDPAVFLTDGEFEAGRTEHRALLEKEFDRRASPSPIRMFNRPFLACAYLFLAVQRFLSVESLPEAPAEEVAPESSASPPVRSPNSAHLFLWLTTHLSPSADACTSVCRRSRPSLPCRWIIPSWTSCSLQRRRIPSRGPHRR